MMRINFDTLRRAWKKSYPRKVALASGVVVVGAAGLAALESRSGSIAEPDKAACCSSAVAVGDAMISPAIGADKDFFEVPSSPPSTFFLLGNNESMQDFPDGHWLPEVFTDGYYKVPPVPAEGEAGYKGDKGYFFNTGCSDPALVAAMGWFDKDSADVNKNGSVVYDADADMTSPFFKPSDFYHVRGRRIAWQKNNYPYSLVSPIFTQLESTSTIETACLQVWNRDSGYYKKAMHNECVQCLTTKGWWRGPLADGSTTGGSLGPARSKDEPELPPEAMRKWVVSGRILNLHPPKFVVARKVLKDVINSASNVRMGVATFGPDRGWFDPPTILKNMRPSCDLSFPTIDEEALDRPSLMKAVNATKFDNKERSIGEALFGLGGYYSSQPTKKTWEKWFAQPIGNMNWGWPGQPNGGTLDNDFGINQSGGGYGKTSDEWLKGDYIDPVTGILYPGMRWEIGGKDKSVCFGCQVSSVIVLTDGAPKYDNSVPITKMMSLLMQWKAKHVATNNKSLVTFNPVDPRSNPTADPGGVNYCDLFEKAPGVKATKADCDYVDYNWPVGQLAGNKNFMDDVSFFLGQADLRDDFEGVQSMRTYTVGYGDNSPMLQSIAMAGKGKFYRANDPQQLRQALLDALGDIKQVSTSFASANISGVQTGGMQSSTFVPRFVPRRGRPYEGHLYRFFYFSEFAQGCQPMKPGSTVKDAFDLNKDGDCDDTFYLDKPAGFTTGVPNIASFTAANIVQENSEGIWVKLNTANITNGQVEGGTPAEPFWDVGKTIGERKAGKECDFANPLAPNSGRCIFTLIDKNNDGKFTAEDNPPIEFHEKNLTQLKSYLLAGGQSFCSTLFAKMLKGTWTGSDADKDECALQLVRFVRGLDVFDYDGDSIRNEERPCTDNADPTDPTSCKLADIFHSTPVTVEPPVDPFLCSLGLSGQCVSTLYEDFSYSVSSEQLCASGTSTKPCYKPTPMSTPPNPSGKRNGVYDEYVKDPTLSKRDRIALVGSNGGMVHALHVGKATQTKTGALDSVYDVGTGQELWAFVPPDLLPKLGLMVSGHEYFVDGTPMVRDLWADGAPGGTPTARGRDGTKQLNEFRTIAVIGERSGGQRYMALDMTDPYLMLKAAQDQDSTDLKPFRWMFPNACDKESLSMGQSWSNFAPKPPPIGPVRLKASASAPATDRDRGWEERWVAVLNGGYSPDLTRGRGVYMVDAWTGEKLWSAEAQPGTTSGGYADVLNKMQPVVASAALVDIGKGTGLQRDLDGFFDTMIVGDMGGQVWTFRFNAPGEVDGATGVVQNWFGARSLEVQREDGSANSHQKAPFFHVAASVLQPDTGWLRSFMGTGDRQHLRTTPGADCSADDLLACIRLKCNVKASFAGEVNGQKRTSLIEYKGGVLTSNAETWNNTGGAACSGSKMELTELALSCPNTAYGTGIFPDGGGTRVYTTESHCSVVNGAWSCVRAPLNTSENQDQGLDAGEKLVVGTNRYFGFHSYGGTKRIFTDAAGAIAFDKLRVTDKQNVTCEGTNCSLVDVTIPPEYYSTMTDANGVAQRFISNVNLAKMKRGGAEDPGWFIRYTNTLAERTATGSTVLAGVVFWSSFSPNTTPGADACSLSGMGDMSYSWQADAISGLPDQASGFQLTGATPGWIASRARPTGAPPSEPAPVIAMSATGGIRYEVAISSAGSAPTTETLNSRRNTTPDISWMEVPRNLHECRHENAEACGDEAP